MPIEIARVKLQDLVGEPGEPAPFTLQSTLATNRHRTTGEHFFVITASKTPKRFATRREAVFLCTDLNTAYFHIKDDPAYLIALKEWGLPYTIEQLPD